MTKSRRQVSCRNPERSIFSTATSGLALPCAPSPSNGNNARPACNNRAEDNTAGDGQRKYSGAEPEVLFDVVDFLVDGDGHGGGGFRYFHFHERADLAHQHTDAAQQDPYPKPGPHQVLTSMRRSSNREWTRI